MRSQPLTDQSEQSVVEFDSYLCVELQQLVNKSILRQTGNYLVNEQFKSFFKQKCQN